MQDNSALHVWTNEAVSRRLAGLAPGRIHRVGAGDTFTAAGFEIRAYGEWHAPIHPDLPPVANTGFLVDSDLFHPGDALTVPDTTVGTLLVPAHGPWSKTGEIIDCVREVAPRQAFAVHDAILSADGTRSIQTILGFLAPHSPCTHLDPGMSREV